MPIRNLGIHITQDAVNLVVIEGAPLGRVRVLNSFKAPISKVEGFEGPAELSVDPSLTEALRTAMGQVNLEKMSNVSLVLPNEEVIVRYFSMPKLTKEEQPAAASFEARKFIPFKIEEVIFDSAISENRRNPKEVLVNFVAIKKERLVHYLASLEAVGIKPKFIEPTSISLRRLLSINKKISAKEHIVLVEIGPTSLGITILNNKLILLSRSVSLSRTEEGQGAGVEERLTSEILNTCEYHKMQFPKEQIAKVILAGGPLSPEAVKTLHGEIGIAVEQIQDLCPRNFKSDLSCDCFAGLGGALRGLKEGAREVNIAVEKASPPTMSKRLLREITAEAVVAFIILSLLYLLFAKEAGLQQEKLRKVITMRPQATIQLDVARISHNELLAFKRDLEKRFQATIVSLMESPYITPKLSRIGAALPSKNIWLTNLEFNGALSQTGGQRGFLRLSGKAISSEEAQDMDLISQFVSNIRNDKELVSGFGKVDLVSVQRERSLDGEETTTFNLILE